jgi:hypothetical protein
MHFPLVTLLCFCVLLHMPYMYFPQVIMTSFILLIISRVTVMALDSLLKYHSVNQCSGAST